MVEGSFPTAKGTVIVASLCLRWCGCKSTSIVRDMLSKNPRVHLLRKLLHQAENREFDRFMKGRGEELDHRTPHVMDKG